MSVGDIIRHHGYGTEEIQQLAKTPWYFLPYIRASRIDLAAFQLFKDDWYHPADISKWFMSLMPVRSTTQETPSSTATTSDQPHYNLSHLHLALVLVWDTLMQYPKEAEKYKAVGSVLETLTALICRTPPFVDYFANDLINSAHFRYSICEYILSQRGDYHLGHDTLPPTDDFPEGSQAKKDRDDLFNKHKQTLFNIASALQTPRTSEVYDFARSCPDFYFVDEITLCYGGAGRTCVDIHMTRMLYTLDDAVKFAREYAASKAPAINYHELLEDLDEYFSYYKHQKLIPNGQTVESLFPEPLTWIGISAFMSMLQTANISLENFLKTFRDFSGEGAWLRPYLRITRDYQEQDNVYNRLHFDVETGCSWRTN